MQRSRSRLARSWLVAWGASWLCLNSCGGSAFSSGDGVGGSGGGMGGSAAGQSSSGGSRLPRVGLTGTDLFYHFAGVGVRYTTDASTSAGSIVMGSIQQDGAPLLLKTDVSGALGLTTLMSFNFVYDRMVEVGRRE